MFDFSPIKILLVVVVTAILLGPDKLPHVAQSLGKAWRSLKNLQTRIEGEVREAMPDLPDSGDLARYARSPIVLLNELAQRATPAEETSNEAPQSAIDDAAVPLGLTLRKPLVNPVTNWQSPSGPFDPSLN